LPWALAVACVVGLGCCVLGVPVLGMLAWVFVGYSKVQPEVQPKSEERVEPVWPDEAAPALEAPLAAARVRRFAPPKDVPLTQDGVTATTDGWKIENTDFPKRTVRLFEVRDLDIKDCRLVFRVQMKTETKEKLENRRIFTRLETAFRPKVTIKKAPTGDTVTEKSWSALARSGNTGWAQEEAATNCRSQPDVIALNLLVEGIGVMWIKDVELVATPLAAPKVGGKSTAKPFVILPRAGGAERPCFNLVEAVAFAKNGDTIEVRGNGPFVSPPIIIQDRRLTIRAAAGFHPILELSPEGVEQNTFLIRATNAPLVLEGLECRYTGAKRWAEDVPGVAIVYSNGSPLHVANCRFFLNRREGHQFGLESIRMNHSLACECRNCLFIVGGGCSLGWWPSASATLTVDNCLLVGGYGASVGGWDAPDRWPSSIRLTHNTLRVHYSLAFWFSKDLSQVTRGASDKRLRVDAVGNVMGTVGLNLNQDSGEKPLPAAEIEALLRRLVAWKDENNLYPQSGKDLLKLTFNHDQPIPQARPRKSLTDWNEFWELTGTGSRQGRIQYKDTDLWTTMTRTPDQVSPEDFRLVPGSPGHGQGPKGRDFGADVDLIGPGPAYERWKKTPEYQQWLKDTEQVKK
jgi:hypothetical protein